MIFGALHVMLDFIFDCRVVGRGAEAVWDLFDIESRPLHDHVGGHEPAGGRIEHGDVLNRVITIVGTSFGVDSGLFLRHAVGQVVGIVVYHFLSKEEFEFTFFCIMI